MGAGLGIGELVATWWPKVDPEQGTVLVVEPERGVQATPPDARKAST